jgi:hypothetical protein
MNFGKVLGTVGMVSSFSQGGITRVSQTGLDGDRQTVAVLEQGGVARDPGITTNLISPFRLEQKPSMDGRV